MLSFVNLNELTNPQQSVLPVLTSVIERKYGADCQSECEEGCHLACNHLDEPTSSQEKRMVELNGATRLEVNVKET
jgi:hypothetical protein